MTQPPNAGAYQKLVQSPLKFRLFMLTRLPAAFFAGLRIRSFSERACTVSIPYRWSTRNPFRSTYFACLAMAAELSTGALCMQQVYERKPSIALLVVAIEARFFKKATGITLFTCDDGEAVKAAVEASIQSGLPQTVAAKSSGRNKAGELVAEFVVTWSFKARSKA